MNSYELLDVPSHASEEDIRAAYLKKVREFPPDRAPEQFEKIRDAYDALRDPRKRARAMLLNTDFMQPVTNLMEDVKPKRIYAGPHLWREALKSK